MLVSSGYSQEKANNTLINLNDIDYSKHTYTYKQVDDCAIKADVYRTESNEKQPVIVWIHGGALIFGNRKYLKEHQLKVYLNTGYTLVSVDYRLAPETKLEYIIEDIRDAFHWVRKDLSEEFNIDPEKVAVVGHSGGAYLALMSGYCLDIPPKAIVSFYGYGDIIGDWYSKPDSFYCSQNLINKDAAYEAVSDSMISEADYHKRYDFYLYCRQNGLWPEAVSGHNPITDKDWFKYYCPLLNVSPGYPPTLLIHGTADTDVPFEQSLSMHNELERIGVANKFIEMDGYGHIFDNPRNSFDDPKIFDAFNDVLKFLKANLDY